MYQLTLMDHVTHHTQSPIVLYTKLDAEYDQEMKFPGFSEL